MSNAFLLRRRGEGWCVSRTLQLRPVAVMTRFAASLKTQRGPAVGTIPEPPVPVAPLSLPHRRFLVAQASGGWRATLRSQGNQYAPRDEFVSRSETPTLRTSCRHHVSRGVCRLAERNAYTTRLPCAPIRPCSVPLDPLAGSRLCLWGRLTTGHAGGQTTHGWPGNLGRVTCQSIAF